MSLAPLRKLLQHGCMTAARAAAVASLHELQPVLSSCMSNRVPTLSSSRASWGPSHSLLYQARNFHAGAVWNAGITVKVPALGESITDGTIATLLKQPGDAVAEDEPILQIETDKVTIDVRAPQAGILEQFLVKEGDNVVVGQDITTISSGQVAPSAAPQPAAQQAAPAPPSPPAAAATPPPPPPQQQPAPSPARPAAPAAAPEAPKRNPSIKFPPRRTPAGERVSDMPAAQAKAFLAAAAKAAEEAAKPRPLIAPLYQKSGPPLPRPARPLVRPAPQIPRTTMTEKEMEAIMLGGAEP